MSNYKRLTNQKWKEHCDLFKDCYDCEIDCGACEFNYMALKRLAELEDKIENRTLIELPCKVGDDDISEITITYKKPIAPLYAIVRYCCQRNKPYKILQYSIIGKDVLNGKDKRLWEWYPSMNFCMVEDGFTNEYDARVRLKELQEKE